MSKPKLLRWSGVPYSPDLYEQELPGITIVLHRDASSYPQSDNGYVITPNGTYAAVEGSGLPTPYTMTPGAARWMYELNSRNNPINASEAAAVAGATLVRGGTTPWSALAALGATTGWAANQWVNNGGYTALIGTAAEGLTRAKDWIRQLEGEEAATEGEAVEGEAENTDTEDTKADEAVAESKPAEATTTNDKAKGDQPAETPKEDPKKPSLWERMFGKSDSKEFSVKRLIFLPFYGYRNGSFWGNVGRVPLDALKLGIGADAVGNGASVYHHLRNGDWSNYHPNSYTLKGADALLLRIGLAYDNVDSQSQTKALNDSTINAKVDSIISSKIDSINRTRIDNDSLAVRDSNRLANDAHERSRVDSLNNDFKNRLSLPR